MSFENLNTYCVDHILNNLSTQKISMVTKVFPEQQEATGAYWRNLRKINFDEMTYDDIEVFLQNIHLCINLKELKNSRIRIRNMAQTTLMAIGHHCPELEILDISGTELNAENSILLKSCKNLKSLSVSVAKYNRGGYYSLKLFADKIKLEHLRVFECQFIRISENDSVRYTLPFFENPDDVPPLGSGDIAMFMSGLSFLDSIIETQTSLKTFDAEYTSDSTVGLLFSSNLQLEDVTLRGPFISHLTALRFCLDILPPSTKRLDVSGCDDMNWSTLLECLKSRNLESLGVKYFHSANNHAHNNFLENLVAAAPTLRSLKIDCFSRYLRTLARVQGFTQLKTLRLVSMYGNHNEGLSSIVNNSLNLELLEIRGKRLDLSEDLFQLIATSPKLKEIIIHSLDQSSSMDYNSLMRCLSTSRILTAANLNFGDALTNEHVLTLIRGSNILTNLDLSGNKLTANLVPQIKEVLTQQKDRTSILNVTFHSSCFSREQIPEGSWHRLLKVNSLFL